MPLTACSANNDNQSCQSSLKRIPYLELLKPIDFIQVNSDTSSLYLAAIAQRYGNRGLHWAAVAAMSIDAGCA